jgi:hypothetical protein
MLANAFESILVAEILMLISVLMLFVFFGFLIRKIVRTQTSLWPLGLLLLLAVGLRIGWIMLTQPEPQSDFWVYWNCAQQFARGDLTFNFIDRHPGIMLLYTFAIIVLGPSLTSGWILNILFSVLFLLALFQVTRELFGKAAAWIATGLATILPQLVTYTALMASEIPAVTYSLVVLWGFLQTRNLKAHQRWVWIGLGILLYGAVLLRSTSLLLLILIPLIALITRRDQLKTTLRGCAAMILTGSLLLSTWLTHQYLLTGVPKLFFGEEIWLAFTTQYKTGGSVTTLSELPYYDKYRAIAKDNSVAGRLRGLKVLKEESFKIIKQDPVKYVLFGFHRLPQIIWGSKTGALWSIKGSKIFKPGHKLERRLSEISTQPWRVLLILSPLGLLGFRRIGSNPALREGLLVITLFLTIWFPFHFLVAVASERYSFQIIPYILILASGGLVSLYELLRGRKPVKPLTTPEPLLVSGPSSEPG